LTVSADYLFLVDDIEPVIINEDNLPVIIGEVGREVSYTTLNRNINLDGIAYHE